MTDLQDRSAVGIPRERFIQHFAFVSDCNKFSPSYIVRLLLLPVTVQSGDGGSRVLSSDPSASPGDGRNLPPPSDPTISGKAGTKGVVCTCVLAHKMHLKCMEPASLGHSLHVALMRSNLREEVEKYVAEMCGCLCVLYGMF